MKLEFQDEVLRFLVQSKEAKKMFEFLESDFFDLQERQIIFELAKSYLKKFNSVPSLAGLTEFFDQEAKRTAIGKDVYNKLEAVIREMFDPIETNTQQIRDSLMDYYQRKLAKEFIKEFSPQVKTGDKELFSQMQRTMNRINSIGETELDDEKNRGDFLLKDHKVGNYSVIEGEPTFLKGLNKMTSVKGFYSPQLIILMGAPKSFKTGTLLNIAVNYVRDGYKVYYADCENGKDRIRDRARQCMLEATFEELISGQFDALLKEMVGRWKVMGGDFKADFYPPNTKCVADIEAELEILRDEHNWVPDIICYDYLDLMRPNDKNIKDKRLGIQATYFDAIALQNKWGMLGFSLSQVNRGAVSAPVMDMTAFAEDFGKAANCHATFALCQTPKEREVNIIRMLPVVQRDGVPYGGKNVCFLKIDAGRMSVKEITMEEAAELLPDTDDAQPKKGGKGFKRVPLNKPLPQSQIPTAGSGVGTITRPKSQVKHPPKDE